MLLKLFPGRPTIVGAIYAAARTSAGKTPGCAPRFPQSRKNNIGIMRIERHINSAGILILVEHSLPALAAIGRAVNSALAVWPERMSQSGHKNNVRIPGIYNHSANGSTVTQSNVLPGLSPIE